MRCRCAVIACFASVAFLVCHAVLADEEKPRPEKDRPEKERPEKERDERRGPDRERIEIKEKIQALQREAAEAREAGKVERAEELMRAARDLESRLRKEVKEKVRPEKEGDKLRGADRERIEIKEKIQALHREADEAKKAGKVERAEELIEAARDLEAKLGKAIKQKEPPKPKEVGSEVLVDRIAKLRKGALHSLREGSKGNAMELWAEADRLDRELRGHIEGLRNEAASPAERPQPPRPRRIERRAEPRPDPRPAPDFRRPGEGGDGPPLNELRREIQQLRQELNEMREHIKRSQEERERRDQPERGEPRRRPTSVL